MLLEVDQVAEQVQVVGRDHVIFLEQSDVSLPSSRLGNVVPQHVLQPDPVELDGEERLILEQVLVDRVENDAEGGKVDAQGNVQHLLLDAVHRDDNRRNLADVVDRLQAPDNLQEVLRSLVDVHGDREHRLLLLLQAQQRAVLVPGFLERREHLPDAVAGQLAITGAGVHELCDGVRGDVALGLEAEAVGDLLREGEVVADHELREYVDLVDPTRPRRPLRPLLEVVLTLLARQQLIVQTVRGRFARHVLAHVGDQEASIGVSSQQADVALGHDLDQLLELPHFTGGERRVDPRQLHLSLRVHLKRESRAGNAGVVVAPTPVAPSPVPVGVLSEASVGALLIPSLQRLHDGKCLPPQPCPVDKLI
mmetsp:Transcript_42597/g.134105  ORF Transcript_42597/g.134105 Transcript_42597/m.134105 type:complete len:365 (-) Transcript_42597:1495-2589(-)